MKQKPPNKTLTDYPDMMVGYDSGIHLNSGSCNIAIGTEAMALTDMAVGADDLSEELDCPDPGATSKSRWWCRKCKKIDECKPKT